MDATQIRRKTRCSCVSMVHTATSCSSMALFFKLLWNRHSTKQCWNRPFPCFSSHFRRFLCLPQNQAEPERSLCEHPHRAGGERTRHHRPCGGAEHVFRWTFWVRDCPVSVIEWVGSKSSLHHIGDWWTVLAAAGIKNPDYRCSVLAPFHHFWDCVPEQYESNGLLLPAVKPSATMRSRQISALRLQTGGRSWWSVWLTLMKSWERCSWRKRFQPMPSWRSVFLKGREKERAHLWNLSVFRKLYFQGNIKI